MSEPKDGEWEQLTLPGFEPSEEPLEVVAARVAARYEEFRLAVGAQIVLNELTRLTTLRPLSELTEADGEVLLWWTNNKVIHCIGAVDRLDADGFATNRDGEIYRLYREDLYFTALPKVRKPDGAR